MTSGLLLATCLCICPEVLQWTYHATEDLGQHCFEVGRLRLFGLRTCTAGGSTGVILAEGRQVLNAPPSHTPCHIYIRFDSHSASSLDPAIMNFSIVIYPS